MDSDKKLDHLEERIRGTETALATLTSNITLNTNNLKENMTRSANDLERRIESLDRNTKENFTGVTNSVNSLNDSLQKLYVSHSGSQNTVNYHEKIGWAVLLVIGTAVLYLIQEFIRAGGAG